MKDKQPNALILLSGGLDSSTVLAMALKEKYRPYGLVISYGQRHTRELESATAVAQAAGIPYQIIEVPFPAVGSSLLDTITEVPDATDAPGIPSTYVPARNTVFISLAASYAEAFGITTIFVGVNAVDYSGYPDCRPEYIEKFNMLLQYATKTGVEGNPIIIKAPLIELTKAQIITQGFSLGVPYELTWSCYRGGNKPCGTCDSCQLRAKGFHDAGFKDPLLASS